MVSRPNSFCIRLASLVALLAGCGSAASKDDPPKPIPECQQYEAAFARCSGQRFAIAEQPAALVKDEHKRAQIRDLCAANLTRIQKACR